MFGCSASSPKQRKQAKGKCVTGEQCELTILIAGFFLKLPFSFAGRHVVVTLSRNFPLASPEGELGPEQDAAASSW